MRLCVNPNFLNFHSSNHSNSSYIKITKDKFQTFSQCLFWLLAADLLTLTWIGGQPVEYPFIIIGQIASVLYYLFLYLNHSQALSKIIYKEGSLQCISVLVNHKRKGILLPRTRGRCSSSTISTRSWNST